MGPDQQTIGRSPTGAAKWAILLLPPLAVCFAVLGSTKPLIALAVAAALPAAYAFVVWPEAATLATVFILYTNSADIAVEFHGVPYVIGAAFILLLTIPLAFFIIIRRERIIIAPAFPILAIFILAMIVAAVNATYPEQAFKEIIKFSAEALGVYVLVTNVVRTPETLRRVCWTLMAAGILMSVVPLYQHLTGTYDNDYGGYAQVSGGVFTVPGAGGASDQQLQRRLTGPIGEQNRYAQVMLMLAPIGLFLGATEKRRIAALLAWGITILILIGMSLAFSRGAAVAVGGLIIIMAWMRYITKTHLLMIAAAIALMLVAMPSYANRIARLQGLWGIVSPESAKEESTPDSALKNRTVEVLAAARMFLDHPLTGVGPGMFNKHYPEYSGMVGSETANSGREAHNLFLGLAAETGLLGITAFFGVLFITFRDLFRTRSRLLESDPRSAMMATGFILAIISYLITGMALHFAFVRFFWLMMALAACASLVVSDELRKPRELKEPV